MLHSDQLSAPPPGFHVIAHTKSVPFAAIAHNTKPLYGIQFHPEMAQCPRGNGVITRFVLNICGCKNDWTVVRTPHWQAYILHGLILTLKTHTRNVSLYYSLQYHRSSQRSSLTIRTTSNEGRHLLLLRNSRKARRSSSLVNTHMASLHVLPQQRRTPCHLGLHSPGQANWKMKP